MDVIRLMKRKKTVINNIVHDMEILLKKHKIRMIQGVGRLTLPRTVEVKARDGSFKVESCAVIIATGSRPAIPRIDGVKYAVTTERLSELGEVPSRVVIIGGGPEGVEFATVFSDMGCEVTVVEVMDALLPLEDRDIGSHLEAVLRGSGVKVMVGTSVTRISERDGVKTVYTQGGAGEATLEADMVVVAMGRRPNSDDIGLEALSISAEEGWIAVDEHLATSIKGVYAVGDVVGGGLVHVATAQGAVAAENALGSESVYDGRVVPRCIYTRPQVAAVGLTEKAARAEGFDLKIGFSSMRGIAKASISGETAGFAKILADASTGRVLGVHIFGENASEVISEASLAIRLDTTISDIARTIHPYPTISEVLREAALDADDSSIFKI